MTKQNNEQNEYINFIENVSNENQEEPLPPYSETIISVTKKVRDGEPKILVEIKTDDIMNNALKSFGLTPPPGGVTELTRMYGVVNTRDVLLMLHQQETDPDQKIKIKSDAESRLVNHQEGFSDPRVSRHLIRQLGEPRSWGEREVNNVYHIIATLLEKYLREYLSFRCQTFRKSGSITTPLAGEENQPSYQGEIDVSTTNKMFLESNGQVYELIAKTTDKESIEEVKSDIVKTMLGSYNNALQQERALLESELQKLTTELNNERSEWIAKGIKLVKDNPNIEIEGDWIKFKNPIYVTDVLYRGQMYVPDILNKEPTKFFVEGLMININTKHAKVISAFHPNISNDGGVCKGNLNNASIDRIIQELPTALTTANLDSSFNNKASGQLKNACKKTKDPVEEVYTDKFFVNHESSNEPETEVNSDGITVFR